MKFQVGFLVFFAVVLMAVAEETPAASERVCEPGKEFTKDCSVCKCNDNGTEFTCDKKDCPAETQKVSEAPVAKGERCIPGEIFKVKCNECRCPSSGVKSEAPCTIIGCSDD